MEQNHCKWLSLEGRSARGSNKGTNGGREEMAG